MALANVNKADEGSASGPKYTGLAVMNVLAVNPNKATLEKLGIKPKDEPVYLSLKEDKDSGKQVPVLRVSFYMHKKVGEGEDAHNVIVNYSIFMEAKLNVSKAGNVELIDKFGRGCYVEKDTVANKSWEADWMDKDSASPAIVGESQLVNFFRNLSNSSKDDTVSLKDLCVDGNRKTLFNEGGEAEIKACLEQVKKANDAKIKVLLGVRFDLEKDKAYQDVFPYNIGRVYADATYFHKELHNIYDRKPEFFKSNYYGEIDYAKEKHTEEQYRLAIFNENAVGKSSKSSKSKPNASKANDMDDDFDMDAEATTASKASDDDEDFDLF
jgi:hypothetical protein